MAIQYSIGGQKKILFTGILFLCFVILVFQYFKLQILHQESYFQKSELNRIREIVVQPSRGLMFDRDGRLVLDNRPSFSVSIIPYEV